MSNLIAEILLRVAKALVAALLGLAIYLVATGPMGEPGTPSLALLSWLSGAAFVLLVETSPL